MKELTVRSRTPGQPVADRVKPDLKNGGPRGENHVFILIHGYQNSEDQARVSYHRFHASLRTALGFHDPKRLGSFWGFHWPGNHRRYLTSVLTYPARVPEALLSAERLAEYITNMEADQEVVLVAHSLGCRIALEVVKRVRLAMEPGEYSGGKIRMVFLLAAAVPVNLCESEDAYLKTIPDCEEYAFYSSRDKALGLAFSFGEQMYSGFWATAVGRTGEPQDDRWTDRRPTGLNHGDYWTADKIARLVVEFLGYKPVVSPTERLLLCAEDVEQRDGAVLPELALPERPLMWRVCKHAAVDRPSSAED
jgi:pimeloyl-ACP methyl ester carboxylesterase